MSIPDISNLPAYDANSLNDLKRLSKGNSPEAIKAASQQFEALFLQQVLKAMRDATPQDGMFDSDQTRTFQSMMDQQLAQMLSAKGSTGLAAMLEKQLSRGQPQDPAKPANPAAAADPAAAPGSSLPKSRFGKDTLRGAALQLLGGPTSASAGTGRADVSAATSPAGASSTGSFVDRLWPHALAASRSTGIPPHFMIAQAALETGWGKAQMKTADGSDSHNLFGIKAGKDWKGPIVEKVTTEHIGGVAHRQVERFRAYGSYAAAFTDYANVLSSNPRYAAVVGNQDASAFARGLQQAGYATDPMYAAKLERIISGSALRKHLMG